MTTITLWLLLAASNGAYNGGTVVVVDRFAAANDCWAVVEKIKNRKGFDQVEFTCTEAKVTR